MQSSRKEQEKGRSLFHRRLTHRTHTRPDNQLKFLLHRLVAVGRLSCGLADRTTVGVHYERLNASVQRSRPGEELTGVLLLYPEHTLLVIECSTEALLTVLQDLRLMGENLHSGLIQEQRILLVSHDLQQRLFQKWSFKLLAESEGRTIVSEDQSSEQLLSQTLHQVRRLGQYLLSAAGQMTGSTVIPDEVPKDAADVIPPQAAVCRLVQMEALLSPARYLSTYHTPLHQQLDSESVWPALEHLQIV